MDRRPSDRSIPEGLAFIVIAIAAGIAVVLWMFVSQTPEDVAPVVGSSAVAEVEVVAPRAVAGEPAAAEEAQPSAASGVKVGQREAAIEAAPAAQAEAPALPAARLVLRIVDQGGAPVQGVSVEWLRRIKGMGIAESPTRGESNADGLLAVPEADRDLEAYFGNDPETAMMREMFTGLGVRPTPPFEAYMSDDELERPGAVWLDAMPDPAHPIEVVLPPFGAVRFVWDPVVDATGVEIEEFWLQVRRSDGKHFSGWRSGLAAEPGATELVFAPVGLGWEVSGNLSSRRVQGVLGHIQGPGPTVEGEVVTLRLEQIERDLVRFHGRFVDVEGAPFTRMVRLEFDAQGTDYPLKTAYTNMTDGRFETQCDRHHLGATGRAYVDAHIDDRRPEATFALDLSDPTRRDFDLGTLVLTPTLGVKQRIVSGRVTDTAGQPVNRAYASVWAQATMLDGEPTESSNGWTRIGYTSTDADGQYALDALAEIPSGEVRVDMHSEDYLRPPSHTVPIGSAGVDFELERGTSVTLDINLDPWTVMFDPVALSFEGEGRRFNPSLMDFYGHYKQRFSGLAPGTYTLTIEMQSGDYVLYQTKVEVDGDVDLGAVDLTGQLALVRLAIEDANGSPPAKYSCSLVDSGAGVMIDRSLATDQTGRVAALVPRAVADAGALEVRDRLGNRAVVPVGAAGVPMDGEEPAFTEVVLAP